MFFDNFKNFYNKYEKTIKENNIDEKDLKSFWVRYCYGLRELESNNESIIYKDELNNIIYKLYIKKSQIIVQPLLLKNITSSNYNNIFILNIGCKLKALKYMDGNIIIEESFQNNKNMLYELKIYDIDATKYILEDNITNFSNINKFEDIILSKELLSDKRVLAYTLNKERKVRVKIYKKEEIFKSEIFDNDIFSPSIFQTVLDFDELLSDLNKGKVKKL